VSLFLFFFSLIACHWKGLGGAVNSYLVNHITQYIREVSFSETFDLKTGSSARKGCGRRHGTTAHYGNFGLPFFSNVSAGQNSTLIAGSLSDEELQQLLRDRRNALGTQQKQ
jgi:hypothetical protein